MNNTSKERRKSAGDENIFKDVNLHVRTHTDSGKQLSDLEILEQVTVLNLDTGEFLDFKTKNSILNRFSFLQVN